MSFKILAQCLSTLAGSSLPCLLWSSTMYALRILWLSLPTQYRKQSFSHVNSRVYSRGVPRNVYEDYESSYDELFLKSKLAILDVQRYRFIATEVYKAVNKHSPIYIQELFEIKDLVYNLRDRIRTKVPKCSSVTYGLKSLRFLGNKIWNSLPINIKMSESLCSFKNKIAKCQPVNI